MNLFRSSPPIVPPRTVEPITLLMYWQGRDAQYPADWTFAIQDNATNLLSRVNRVLMAYGKNPGVRSGWRPPAVNAATPNAKSGSAHLSGQAVDLNDTDGALKAWVRYNVDELIKAGLYAEEFASTPSWLHLQSRKPLSGKTIFKP